MILNDFTQYALIAITTWLAGFILICTTKNKIINTIGNSIITSGITLLAYFIIVLWIQLERPPMRTLGETRLWYSLFLSLIGMIIYLRWKKRWYRLLSLVFLALFLFMGALFLYINIKIPDNFDKTLMPALQSIWFVPHVIVYIFAYNLLGLSMIVAIIGLYLYYFRNFEESVIKLADNLVYIGFAFLTFGLLFGALWAKTAWGHYWTWDPKETWAFITWLMYLIYIHYRHNKPQKVVTPLWTLSLAFFVLLIAWFGINYLPSAQNSVHVYGS